MTRIPSSGWATFQTFVWMPILTLAALNCFEWVATLSRVGQATFFITWFYVMLAPTIYAVWILPALDARRAAKSPDSE